MDLNQYKTMLLNLLPQGLAWPRQNGLVRDDIIEGEAAELARVDGRVSDMIREADPRSATETLEDWERVAGLPDTCVIPSTITLQERRTRLVQKLTSTGGQSVAYYEGIAEGLGYPVETFEYRPFICGQSECGLGEIEGFNSTYLIGVTDDLSIRYYWKVAVLEPRVTWFQCGASECGKDPLAKIDEAVDLECILNKLKPAHTELIFDYEGD